MSLEISFARGLNRQSTGDKVYRLGLAVFPRHCRPMNLNFTTLPHEYAICRLPSDATIPDWADGDGLVSVTRADDELSIVCHAERVPSGVNAQRGWSALKVETLADLDEAGVVMGAVTPISSAGLGVFVISTHLRDYLLVRSAELLRAKSVLKTAGHSVD